MAPSALPTFDFRANVTGLLQRILFAVLLVGWAAYFSWMAFVSKGVLEHGDGIAHFRRSGMRPKTPNSYLTIGANRCLRCWLRRFAQIGFSGNDFVHRVVVPHHRLPAICSGPKSGNRLHRAWLTPLLHRCCRPWCITAWLNAGMTGNSASPRLRWLRCLFFLQKKYVAGATRFFPFPFFRGQEGMLILPVLCRFFGHGKTMESAAVFGYGICVIRHHRNRCFP